MINDLRYAVTFPINGITLSGGHTFQPGITAISGRNGSGKSFIREMLRYGLFGKKALRGPASDYKSLDMEQSFTVAGKTYVVKRGKKEVLSLDDEQLAVGAEAVNKEIMKILGFGLEVFDVVCAVNQKESERLTQLTPAKRKELIDDVVGLSAQEAVEAACRKEASELRREVETLTRVLKAPTEPVCPEGYRPSDEIEAELAETKRIVAEEQRLQRIIDSVGTAPEAPAAPLADVAALEAHEAARLESDARYKALYSSIERIPDAVYTAEELDAAEAVAEYEAEVKRRGPPPSLGLSIEEVDQLLQDWATIEVLEKVVGTTVACPQCDHEFDAGHDCPVQPPHSPRDLRAERERLTEWAKPLMAPKGEHLTKAQIIAGRQALDRAAEKAAMQAELDALPDLEDKSAELRAARAAAQEWAVYEAAKAAYDARAEAGAVAADELAALPTLTTTVEALDAAYVAARVYDSQIEAYAADKARFDELSAEIAEKQARADGFAAGAKGLVEARRTLKAFLAPSLSRVATSLIQQMTVNAKHQLSSIEVDEDMNITADGQDASTFNGAHATMINLALRLALQQVLVSRVFPVFIGDEIDSDLDAANSQAIADALNNVKGQLAQIVLISHKQLEDIDHSIAL